MRSTKCELCTSVKTIWVQVNDCIWAECFGGTLKFGVPEIVQDMIICMDCGHIKGNRTDAKSNKTEV